MKPATRATVRCLQAWTRVGVLSALIASGCASESTRLALDTQRRADEVQQAVFDRQHEALCVLLYRDLTARLTATGVELTPARQAALNEACNNRDLLEFWVVEHERARALRLVGVDAKLASDQPAIDLLLKEINARAGRARQQLAAQAGTQTAEAVKGE